ncbi:MAG: carboxypeptidase-like regulatory domain-containing protein [Terriglobus sp.]
MNRFRCTTMLFTAMLFATPMLVSTPAHAQAAATRSITGTVTDKSGTAVKGAVVHLKDTRALSQRSYITAEDGQFRFAQLSTSTDYEVWADLNGQKTDKKSISSFDNKASQSITLKMP